MRVSSTWEFFGGSFLKRGLRVLREKNPRTPDLLSLFRTFFIAGMAH